MLARNASAQLNIYEPMGGAVGAAVGYVLCVRGFVGKAFRYVGCRMDGLGKRHWENLWDLGTLPRVFFAKAISGKI